jgi:hypothetical protein
MRYQFTFSLFIIYAAYSTIIAQKHDYVWLMGENSLTVPEYAGTVIDFNTQTPDIYYEFRDMFFFQTNASMCDTAGNLLFYTNGIYVANALGEPMENGEGLNPGEQAEIWQDYGYILDQGAIALPAPESNHVYYLLHLDKELITTLNDVISRNFYLSLINMSENGGIGKVLSKNNIIITDNLQLGKLTASKHANGRDWWIILRKYASNIFYRFLLTPSGLEILDQQQIGNTIPHNGVGQAVFSPDGAKYAVYETISIQEGHYINIYDFDRCIGELSDPVQINMIDTAWAGGVAISPNNRFLYVSSFKYLYQYDLWAANIESSRITVATWDGFEENGFFATTFYLAQLAPDGKIYINSNNGVSYLHVINNPDSLGLACDVCQHCIDLPTINAVSLPNFPNYRLHHLAGSPCDTLRSPPVALWGYELQGAALHCTDSSRHDIRTWHWDFGDGHTDTLQNPVHTYAAGGVYNVCLAVSNPRGADTLCQVVQVVVDGVEEAEEQEGGLRAFPNPATQTTRVQWTQESLSQCDLIVLDVFGRQVCRYVIPAGIRHYDLPVNNLPQGLYVVKAVVNNTGYSGKVIVKH